MQFLVLLLFTCFFSSNYHLFYQSTHFCVAQYDRIGSAYDRNRDAKFYNKSGTKYPERIGLQHCEEADRKKGFCTTPSPINHGSTNEKKNLLNNTNG